MATIVISGEAAHTGLPAPHASTMHALPGSIASATSLRRSEGTRAVRHLVSSVAKKLICGITHARNIATPMRVIHNSARGARC